MDVKECDLTIRNLDYEDFEYEQRNLKRNGYKRVENAYWVEVWEKNGWTVCIVRA